MNSTMPTAQVYDLKVKFTNCTAAAEPPPPPPAHTHRQIHKQLTFEQTPFQAICTIWWQLLFQLLTHLTEEADLVYEYFIMY